MGCSPTLASSHHLTIWYCIGCLWVCAQTKKPTTYLFKMLFSEYKTNYFMVIHMKRFYKLTKFLENSVKSDRRKTV